MRKSFYVLSAIFLITLIWLNTTCRKEEYVIVYSKVSTTRVYNITSTTASVEGSIDSLTSAAHDEFGFCMDTLSNPTVYKQKLLATGTVQLGSFGGTISSLKPAKTYYIRAFIKDNKKYLYGQEKSFTTTAAIVPTVTTNSVTDITSSVATCGGNVTSAGDKPVISKGVCYDTVANPTIEKNKTFDGWGTGTFTSKLINLLPNKTYYAKAYAVSEFGVGYGTQKSFTTKNLLYSFHDDYSDNKNNWDVGDFTGGTSKVENGKYTISYATSGYLYLMYNKFPDFKTIATMDFEISTSLKIYGYGLVGLGTSLIGGLIWNSDDNHFRYFVVKKVYALEKVYKSKSYAYSYSIGQFDGSYTTWKDYTTFAGKDSTKLTIKKANGNLYFFVDDVQVYSHDYTTISYDGVGYLIQNSTIEADYLFIDQKDYKKSSETEFKELKSLPGGSSIIESFLLR
jgi:hypothetical protein